MGNAEIEFDVPAEMRDGTVLRADVYRPTGGGPWPTLLARLPYDKQLPTHLVTLDPLTAVRHGYQVVIQDTRGRFASGGKWEPLLHEEADGYDTVRWAARLPGSNGRVGMLGSSYYGNTQWMAAIAQPPELQALAPTVTWSEPLDGVFARGGALELGIFAHWSLQQGIADVFRRYADDSGELTKRLATLVGDIDRLRTDTYWELPTGNPPTVARNEISGTLFDRTLHDPDAVDACRVAGKYERIDLPTFNVGGWYDIFAQGTLDNYAAMAAAGRPARLVMGPWVHGPFLQQVGEVNFGCAANAMLLDLRRPLGGMQLEFFDQWLRDVPPVDEAAPVKIFVMGVNRWRDESAWPLARAVDTAFHLRAGGGLTAGLPDTGEAPDEYVYDPADPVITTGGALLMSPEFGAGPADQSRVEARPDVLVFSTQPLPADVEVTGRVRVTLWAATDAPSTDWVARLCDVDASGVSRNVTDGILRVGRAAGEVTRHEIDLWSTSMVFRAGHRIRVQVTSSNFPRWDRNLNTGEPIDVGTTMRPARQTVFHDASRPSHILLPIVAS